MTQRAAARDAPVRLIGCGIFKREFGLLPDRLKDAFEPVFLDSMLHMVPGQLDSVLGSILDFNPERRSVMAFGDCCPHMEELSARPRSARTAGDNCCEIYLGTERYRTFRKERTFFLMPEWAARWEGIFKDALGLKTSVLAREFVRHSMNQAVYIDTGLVPVPMDELAGFSEYTGLDVAIEPTGPAHFAAALDDALRIASRPGSVSGSSHG